MLVSSLRNDLNDSSLQFIKIYRCCISNKGKKRHTTKETEQRAEQTHNILVSILVFLRDSYLFSDSESYVLFRMNMMSTLSIEYVLRRFRDIKISMNSYKYPKL